MSNLTELRQHLNAVRQTRQITNAMFLLSTARMKQSMKNIDYNLYYLHRLRATMKDVLSKTKHSEIHNRFIEEQEEGKQLFLVISSDRGMCGSYNSDIVNLACEKLGNREDYFLASFGSEGTEVFVRRGIKPDLVIDDALQHPSFDQAQRIAMQMKKLYLDHRIKEAYVVYTEYVNSAVQQPVCRRLLPLLRRDFLDVDYELNYQASMIYEPSVDEVFDIMVPQYLIGFMYDVFMQASASENCARMNAMQNATHNADEMITRLSAEINAARQLAITNEITEIAAAGEISGAV